MRFSAPPGRRLSSSAAQSPQPARPGIARALVGVLPVRALFSSFHVRDVLYGPVRQVPAILPPIGSLALELFALIGRSAETWRTCAESAPQLVERCPVKRG